MGTESVSFEPLRALVATREEWLMERILFFAKSRHYAKYTSTLKEAWRASICGLSEPIIAAIERGQTDIELGPEDDYVSDPIAAFGVLQAQRHRSRGITIGLFLGFMKYYRQAYHDLIEEGGLTDDEVRSYNHFIDRFFDRVELGFCVEWSSHSESSKIQEMQVSSRQLTNEKNKFLTIFESGDDPAFFVNVRGIVENVNHTAAWLFAGIQVPGGAYYAPTEIALDWPDGRFLARIGSSKGRFVEELELKTRQGVRTFLARTQPMLDVSEKYNGTIVFLHDVTASRRARSELLESEAKFRALFEQAAIGVARIDRKGQFLELNHRFAEILGYAPDSLVGQSLRSVIPSEKISEEIRLANEIHSGRLRTYEHDKRFERPDGSYVWISLTVSLVRDADGKPLWFVVMIQDVTRARDLENRLQQSQKMDALGNLAAGIAHDFNNMLLPILSMTRMTLKETDEESRAHRRLSRVMDAAERAQALVGRIMAFSREEVQDLHDSSVSSVVEKAFDLLRPTLPTSIRLHATGTDLRSKVYMNEDQILTSIVNLVTNARDAILETENLRGDIEIGVRGLTLDEDQTSAIPGIAPGRYACIFITDNGCGMDSATLSRAMDPFFTTKEVGYGTGLGLSTTHRVAVDHGGAMTLRSAPGEGTTVSLYLPEAIPDQKLPSGDPNTDAPLDVLVHSTS